MKTKETKETKKEVKLTGPRYWKSLDEYADSPDFKEWIHNEFPQGASDAFGVNRRHFMKIMGASFAFAGLGLAGCRRPVGKIVPYSKQPENMIPGVPKYFATSMPGSDSIPLIVETHMARPTKIEGNANFKRYRGATNSFAQASILDLYDPDRSQSSVDIKPNKNISREAVHDIVRALHHKHLETKGAKLAVLLDGSKSMSRARLLARFREHFPKAVIAEYEPIDHTTAEKALKVVSGKYLRPDYKFEGPSDRGLP